MKLDFALPSVDNKVSLAIHIEGNEDAEAIVVFSHGMAEHKERYYEFIHYLCEHQFLCVIHDHRGHGDSVHHEDDYGYFYDEKGDATVDDLTMIIAYLKDKFPSKKIYLFAHSMGTLVARNYIQNHDDQINKLILCGPPFHNQAASVAYHLASLLTKLQGDKKRSKLIHNMAFGAFNKKFGGILENEWVNSNCEEVHLYNNNPKCGYIFTNNGFKCLFYLLKHCYLQDAYQVNHADLEILFIAGEEDPVIGNKKQWRAQQSFLKTLGYDNITSKLYTGMRHEILNEKDKQIVFADILAFLKK